MSTPEASATSGRIEGYDIARCVAIFSMVMVNFNLSMEAVTNGPGWLQWLCGLIPCRAAATFVTLAGVGMTLMASRARKSGDLSAQRNVQHLLLKRAAFLFVVGLLFFPIWPADILHFYGVYIAIGALVLFASGKVLWGMSLAAIAGFVVLLATLDYEVGWNWETFAYADFWTINGFIRNLFFNGWHPVFPWLAYLLIGIWLGRLDLGNAVIRRRVLISGLLLTVFGEGLSWILVSTLSGTVLPAEEAIALFGREPLPPMPLFLVQTIGTAFVVIALCVGLGQRFPGHVLLKPLVYTGQLALSVYVAHVFLGLGTLEAFGRLQGQTLVFSVSMAILFCTISLAVCTFWRKNLSRGPLELAMRWITG